MSLEENKALVRNYIEEIYNGNLDIIEDVVADEYVATAGPLSPAQYKANNVAMARAFPDRRVHIHEIIAEGDWVALHTTVEATHLGEWRGIPPTGKRVTWTGTIFRRVRDGKIVRGYATFDWLGVMQQLGVTFVPPT